MVLKPAPTGAREEEPELEPEEYSPDTESIRDSFKAAAAALSAPDDHEVIDGIVNPKLPKIPDHLIKRRKA